MTNLKIFSHGEYKLRYLSTENTSYSNNEVVRIGLGQDGCSIKRPPLFSLFSSVVEVGAREHVINIMKEVVMRREQGIMLSWMQVGLRTASLKARPARILVHVSGDAHLSQQLPPHDPIFSVPSRSFHTPWHGLAHTYSFPNMLRNIH